MCALIKMRFQFILVIVNYYVIGGSSLSLKQWNRINYASTTTNATSLDYSNINNSYTCGQIIDQLLPSQHDFIQSPNYPNTYSRALECTWILKATNGTRIYVTIFDIDISTSSGEFPKESDQEEDLFYISLSGLWQDSQRYFCVNS